MFFCGTKITVAYQSYTLLKEATLSRAFLKGEREKTVFLSFSSYKETLVKSFIKKNITPIF